MSGVGTAGKTNSHFWKEPERGLLPGSDSGHARVQFKKNGVAIVGLVVGACLAVGAVVMLGENTGEKTDSASLSTMEFGTGYSSTSGFTLLNPDPKVLKWTETNTSGEMVGWLNVPLLHDPVLRQYETDPPRVCLQVRVLPARNQPAKLGPLLAHCGGPGSGNDCANSMVSMGFFNLAGMTGIMDNYDLWSINQRGIDQNASECPFEYSTGEAIAPHPPIRCNEIEALVEKEGFEGAAKRLAGNPDMQTYREIIQPILEDGALPLNMEVGLTFRNETWARWFYRLVKLQHNLCYTADRYKLKSPTTHRVYSMFHYTGTRDLAYDIDLFRQAIGAEKMSIRGASYGTAVGGVYATLFPEKVFRMMVDGDVSPNPDVFSLAQESGSGIEATWTGLADSCDSSVMQGLPEGERCAAGPDVTGKFRAIIGNTQNKTNAVAVFGQAFFTIMNLNSGVPFIASLFVPSLMERIAEIYNTFRSKATNLGDVKTEKFLPVMLPGGIPREDKFKLAIQAAVLGLDTAGRITEDQFIMWWSEAKEKMPLGAYWAMMWTVMIGTWPVLPNPVPPYHSVDLQGLIVGNLHDPRTGYSNTQDFVKGFPKMRVLTWQGYGHCLLPPPPSQSKAILDKYHEQVAAGEVPTYTDETGLLLCNYLAFKYLANGTLPERGHVCRVRQPIQVGEKKQSSQPY